MLRWVFRLSLFVALLLAGLAGRAAVREHPALGGTEPTASTGGLCVDCPDRDLGEVRVGEHVLEFVVTNPSSVEHRILGMCGQCGPTCCVKPVNDVAVTIGPRQTCTIRCTVLTLKPGPFDGPLTVFVDHGGTHAIRLTVRGVATLSPKGPGHASDTPAAALP